MKKLILISALLFTVSILADIDESFDDKKHEEVWKNIGELEGAFAWFNQARTDYMNYSGSRERMKYNPSSRIIIFQPNEEGLEVCDFKKAKKFDKKAYLKQENTFLNKEYLPYGWENRPAELNELTPAKLNGEFFQYWHQVSSQLGIREFKDARKMIDRRAKKAKTFKEMLTKLKLDFTAPKKNKQYAINSVQIRVKVSLDTNPIKIDFQGCVLVLSSQETIERKRTILERSLAREELAQEYFTVGTLEMPLTEGGEQLYRDRIISAIKKQDNSFDFSRKRKLKELGGLQTLIKDAATDFWSLPNFYKKRARETLKKDPFESPEEYNERLSRLKVEEKRYGIFRIDEPLNLMNSEAEAANSNNKISTTYDTENKQFVVSIRSNSYGKFELTSFTKDSDFSQYDAQNAFGAKVRVSESRSTRGRFVVIGRNGSEVLNYRFPITRDKARQLSKNLKIIILVSYLQSNDNLTSFDENHSATYSDPFGFSSRTYLINSRIASVILYDERTKKIIAHEADYGALFPNVVRQKSKEVVYSAKGTAEYKSRNSFGSSATSIIFDGTTGKKYQSKICRPSDDLSTNGKTRHSDEGELRVKTKETIRIIWEADSLSQMDGENIYSRDLGSYGGRCMQHLFLNDVFIMKEGSNFDKPTWFVGYY